MLAARIEQLEDSIKRYLVELDRADRDAAAVLPHRVAHLKDKIAKVKQQIQALKEIGEQMKASEDGQISLTDPDARSMATSGRGTGIVGYNLQTVVDAKHHLIVAHEVTNEGHDRNQLAHMAKLAKAATGEDELIALADRGYYEGYEILECERAGVAAVIPKSMTSNNAAAGLFDKRDFVYDDKALPGGQQCPPPYDFRRGRQDPAQVLVVRLPSVSYEAAMYQRQGTAHLSVGTRRHTGCRSRAARRCT